MVSVAGERGCICRDACERMQPSFCGMASDLALAGDRVEPRELALTHQPGGMVPRERRNQRTDPGSQLHRKVGCRGPHQGLHVLKRDLVFGPQPFWILSLTHIRHRD